MNKQDLENLVMDTYLLELVKLRPEMKELKTEEEIEVFVEQSFTKEQLLESYRKASESVIGGIEKIRS